ncbi:MAG: DUF4402 domain-containing protein [Bacteroidales bacterium]|nr:DUF4402 domain-containing protein [Bacteroidales bacterium]
MIHNKYRLTLYAFLLAAGLYFISVPVPLSAQDPEIVGTITAELIEVLSASEVSPLGFGRFFIDGDGTGSIIVEALPSVNRTTTGSSVHLALGGHEGAAVYEIRGYPESTISITLPSPTQISNIENSAYKMTVNDWTLHPSQAPTLDQEGKLTLYLGASLQVGTLADNPIGQYYGTYTLIFTYD